MHIEKREDPNPEIGYEIRDINPKAIWMSTLYFFGFAILSAVLGGIVFFTMNPGVKPVEESAIARQRPKLAATVPLLQSNMLVKTDIMLMRQREEQRLYGAPAQNRDGTFSIPIAAAMKMVVESGGRAVQPREAAPANTGAVDPSRVYTGSTGAIPGTLPPSASEGAHAPAAAAAPAPTHGGQQ
jgi:hypothetical protein